MQQRPTMRYGRCMTWQRLSHNPEVAGSNPVPTAAEAAPTQTTFATEKTRLPCAEATSCGAADLDRPSNSICTENARDRDAALNRTSTQSQSVLTQTVV